MTALSLLLVFKILITTVLTVVPFLLLSERRLAPLLGVTGGGTLFRLYGVAILALLVGYSSGFWTIAAGRFPWGVVAMGIVSNGGAALVLFASGAWRRARFLSFFVAVVTVALAAAALYSREALMPLW